MAMPPKSMTALKRPSTSSRLPAATSPCTHTGATFPARTQRRFPEGSSTRSIHPMGLSLDRRTGLCVVYTQRTTSKEIVLTRRRRTPGVDLLQCGQEGGEIRGECIQIGDALASRMNTIQPAVNRPVPGVVLIRLSERKRGGDRQGKMRCQSRQPGLLFHHLGRIVSGARQTHAHSVAEMKGPVVPAAGGNRLHRMIRPVRKLSGDQSSYQGRIDLHPGLPSRRRTWIRSPRDPVRHRNWYRQTTT